MKAFHRQFIVSNHPQETNGIPEGWETHTFGKFTVWNCPSLQLTHASSPTGQCLLFGYLLDPNHPESTTKDLLAKIASLPKWESIREETSRLTGRFVLLFWNLDSTPATPATYATYAICDPCGFKPLYYNTGTSIHLSSNPKLLAKILGRRPSKILEAAWEKNIQRFPSGVEIYQGIKDLTANHEVELLTKKQNRFWPNKPLEQLSEKEGTVLGAHRIQKNVLAGNNRFPLALGLTAGWDSRLLLAACQPIKTQIEAYTLRYITMTGKEPDLVISPKVAEIAGISHKIYHCDQTPTEEFLQAYQENTWTNRPEWAHIAYNLQRHFPQGSICLKGDASEIARYPNHRPTLSPKIAAGQHTHFWLEIPELIDHCDQWFEKNEQICKETGVYLLNLFYWEHVMSTCQGQSQIDSDPIMDKFSPYNDRVLFETQLATPTKSRIPPFFSLQNAMIEILWPEINKCQKNKGYLHGFLSNIRKKLQKEKIMQVKTRH